MGDKLQKLIAAYEELEKKMVDPAQASEINVKIARNYLMYSTWYNEDE